MNGGRTMTAHLKNTNRYKVSAGGPVKLTDWDCEETSAFPGGKKKAEKELIKQREQLEQLQGLLYAEHKHKLLIVLQGMDTAGKDSTIRFVFEGINPQGVRVASFKVPTPEELDHDYLWRVHQKVPAKGEIVIFNRSHYEDVLTVRVHGLISSEIAEKRYRQIIEFERMLVEEGTVILKFFLYINKAEQKKRLQERLQDPVKQWKFSLGDLAERKLWPQYVKAYERMLGQTSWEGAPWYIIPANTKWYRNVMIAQVITARLQKLDMRYPEPKDDLSQVVID